MQKSTFVIDLPHCQLTVHFREGVLTLTVFEFVSTEYLQGVFTDQTLPSDIRNQYDTVASLHYYLTQLKQRKSLLSYSHGELRVEDYVGGGTIHTECILPLEAKSGQERCEVLQQRLNNNSKAVKEMEMESEVLQHKLTQQEGKAQNIVRQKTAMAGRHNEQQYQLKNAQKKQQDLSTKIEVKKSYLQRLRECVRKMSPSQQVQKQLLEIWPKQLQWQVNQQNKWWSCFTRESNNRVSCQVELNVGVCQFSNTKHIPIYGVWNFRVGVVQLRDGLIIGATDETNLNYHSLFNHSTTVCYHAPSNSVFSGGLPIRVEARSMREGDVLEVVVDRDKQLVQYKVKDTVIGKSAIPPKLSKQRLYPFVQLTRGDVVELGGYNFQMEQERNERM